MRAAAFASCSAGLLALGLLTTAPAYADVTFNVSGTFSDATPLDGSMTIDTGTGAVTNLDLDVPGVDQGFYHVTNIEPNGSDIELDATNGGLATFQLTVVISPFTPLSGGAPFMGFTGGTISTGSVATIMPFMVVHSGLTGAVTVPEPPTLAILGLGLAGIGYARRGNRNP